MQRDNSMDYAIPANWLVEAGVADFTPTQRSFRCSEPHTVVSLAAIAPIRREVSLDRNGFVRSRMMAILRGIRDDVPMPPIIVWPALEGPWKYELRDGYHRLYASQTVGFSHVPADVIERY